MTASCLLGCDAFGFASPHAVCETASTKMTTADDRILFTFRTPFIWLPQTDMGLTLLRKPTEGKLERLGHLRASHVTFANCAVVDEGAYPKTLSIPITVTRTTGSSSRSISSSATAPPA